MMTVSREIDEFDGCVYDCPLYPGVWSDWCEIDCKKFVTMSDKFVFCKE